MGDPLLLKPWRETTGHKKRKRLCVIVCVHSLWWQASTEKQCRSYQRCISDPMHVLLFSLAPILMCPCSWISSAEPKHRVLHKGIARSGQMGKDSWVYWHSNISHLTSSSAWSLRGWRKTREGNRGIVRSALSSREDWVLVCVFLRSRNAETKTL